MSPVGRAISATLLLGPPIAIATAYAALVWDGTIAAPDILAIAEQIAPMAQGTVAFAIGLALAAIVFCAAIARILYAARSGDGLTVAISLVLTTAALAALLSSRTVYDMTAGVLIYLSNITLSAIVYGASRITRAIEAKGDGKTGTV